jgi:hypothetical protein
MPTTFTGSLYLRVKADTGGDALADTVFIDSLYVRTLISPVNTTVNVVWDLSADDGAGQNDVTQYNVYFSDAAAAGNSAGPFLYLDSVAAGTNIYRHFGEADDFVDNIWYVVTAQDAYSESWSTGRATKFNVAPAAQNVLVDGATEVLVTPGDMVALTANIFDDSSTWEDILKLDGAEWYDTVDPGEGLGTPMTGDGLWDSIMEPFTATIDTTGWPGLSSHAIYVRGHEYGPGNTGTGWGAVSFVVWINTTAAPTGYTIDLAGSSAGDWVFVSFPIEISGNVDAILNDATLGDGLTTWDVAKWYDATDIMDPWKTFRVGSTVNDLTTVTNQMGVWLHLTGNGGDQMITTGSSGSYPAASVNINLFTGWNLVGYPSATGRLASVTLPAQADMVSVYQVAAPYVTDYTDLSLVTLTHGNGYWVHVTADCLWTVDP